MSRLRLSLAENAAGFLREAVRKALTAEERPSEWRFAVLSLVQSVELALKDRLKQEHPVLLYRDVDKQRETVNIHLAVQRLKDIAKLSFGSGDLAALRTAVEWRNQIVHYEFDYSVTEVKAGVATVLGFVTDFFRLHLDTTMDEVLPPRLCREVVSLKDFRIELERRAQERIAAESIAASGLDWCRRCGSHAFVLVPEREQCYLCGYKPDFVECAICGEWKFPEDCEEYEIAFERMELVCDDCLRREQRVQLGVDMKLGK